MRYVQNEIEIRQIKENITVFLPLDYVVYNCLTNCIPSIILLHITIAAIYSFFYCIHIIIISLANFFSHFVIMKTISSRSTFLRSTAPKAFRRLSERSKQEKQKIPQTTDFGR